MKQLELFEVVEEIRKEKKSIYSHIDAIENMLKNASSEEEKRNLYLELSPKLSRYYALLQKHNEQLLESIKIYYKEMEGGTHNLSALREI
ncbi:MAG: hypothetical protein N3A54_03000 [Patescibacteria group bacterium]|nr:hypothetical protein [Patescibacteria group bacterium]